MVALKECSEIKLFSSVKSHNKVASYEFSFAIVRNLPDLKENTGLLLSQIPSETAIFFNLNKEADGQMLLPAIGYRSINFPLNPVVLL